MMPRKPSSVICLYSSAGGSLFSAYFFQYAWSKRCDTRSPYS